MKYYTFPIIFTSIMLLLIIKKIDGCHSNVLYFSSYFNYLEVLNMQSFFHSSLIVILHFFHFLFNHKHYLSLILIILFSLMYFELQLGISTLVFLLFRLFSGNEYRIILLFHSSLIVIITFIFLFNCYFLFFYSIVNVFLH